MAAILSEKKRLQEFEHTMDVVFFDDLRDQIATAGFTERTREKLDIYDAFVRRSPLPFRDKLVEKKFEEFNEALSDFDGYLTEMSISKFGKKRKLLRYLVPKDSRDEFTKRFRVLWDAYRKFLAIAKNNIEQAAKINDDKKFITRDDGTGEFFCNGVLVKSKDPKNASYRDNIYFKIFVVLYEHSDASGLLSYARIDQLLTKMGEGAVMDAKKRAERVQNAVNNLYRYTNLPKKAPDGKGVIQISKGKGLILHNPYIKK